MAQEETILLHFDIDEQPAVNSIKDLRTANSQLRAERDKVNISTKEGQELVQKLNVTIDKNNKLIKDNSSALEKQRQNVGNYSKSIEEAAGNINIMGTNVSQAGSKLALFGTGAGAVVGIVSALGAAYARSAIGAKDLEFASNQLSFATTILTDRFAGLFSSVEDGQGIVSKLVNSFVDAFGGLDTAVLSNLAANAQEELEQIERDRIRIQAEINDKLSDNLELLTDISNSETSLADKQTKKQQVEDNIHDIALARLDLLNRQEVQEKIIGATTANKEALERKLNEIQAERTRVQKEETKGVEKLNKQLNAAVNAENKRLEAIDEAATKKRLAAVNTTGTIAESGTGQNITEFGEQEIRLSNQVTATVVKNNEVKGESAQQYVDRVSALQETQAEGARDLSATLAAIADEGSEAQEALALTSIAINSGIGVSEAVKAGAGIPFPGNLAAILSGITAVLAGIAQAKNLLFGGAAAGGGDFITTKPTLLMVGDNPGHRERVTVEPLSGRGKTQVNPKSGLLQMAGGGSLTVNDGGFIANSNTQSTREAMMMANFLKNQPPIYASWTEGEKVGRQVRFKQNKTRF